MDPGEIFGTGIRICGISRFQKYTGYPKSGTEGFRQLSITTNIEMFRTGTAGLRSTFHCPRGENEIRYAQDIFLLLNALHLFVKPLKVLLADVALPD
jgi:hypothetical protein